MWSSKHGQKVHKVHKQLYIIWTVRNRLDGTVASVIRISLPVKWSVTMSLSSTISETLALWPWEWWDILHLWQQDIPVFWEGLWLFALRSARKTHPPIRTLEIFVWLWRWSGGGIWRGGLPPPQNIVIKLVCPHPTPHFTPGPDNKSYIHY